MKPKRLISLLVAVCMMITMLPLSAVTAFAADTSTVHEANDGEGIYRYAYKENEDGETVTITEFLGPVDPANPGPYDIDIPEKLDGYTVTGLGKDSFSIDDLYSPLYEIHLNKIHSVTIPQSVTSIGKDAFTNCRGLNSLTIKDAAISIGDWAFAQCYSLSSLSLGKNIKTIGDHAFDDCRGLTSVTIPQSVTSIGQKAFNSCISLTTLSFGEKSFGENIETIGNDAFYYCIALKEVTIPQSVTSIGNDAFGQCHDLQSLTIKDAATSIGHRAFLGCTSLATISLGENIKTIGANAFNSCFGLTSVTIPENVTTIRPGTFSYCKHLEYIMLPAGLTSFQDSLKGCPAECVIYYNNDKDTARHWFGDNAVGDNAVLAGHKLLYLCKVTFDANGGTFEDGTSAPVTIKEIWRTEKVATKGDVPANPTRKGYVFDGWYYTDNVARAMTAFDPATEGVPDTITLYAAWRQTDTLATVAISGLSDGDTLVKGKEYPFTVKITPDGDAGNGKLTLTLANGGTLYQQKDDGTWEEMTSSELDIALVSKSYQFKLIPDQTGPNTLTAGVQKDGLTGAPNTDEVSFTVRDYEDGTVTIEGLENAVIKEGESKDFTVKVDPKDDAKLGEAFIDFGDKNSEIEYKDKTGAYQPMPNGGLPIDLGDVKEPYAFRIAPKETGKQTLTAAVKQGENELAKDEKDFVVSEMPILTLKDGVITSVTVPGKNGADPEDITEIVKKNAKEDGSFHVPEGATVSVAFDKDAFADSGLKFGHWDITGLDDPNAYQDKESFSFEMPAKGVTLKAMTQDASIEDDEPNVLGTVAIIGTAAVGTAVLGYQAYSLGAEFAGKLMALPYFPSNRSALAMMLWEDAGKPMPESELLYPDVGQEERDMDLQHAARWAMENELIPDLNDEGTAPEEMKFFPANPVSKLDVLNAWQKAQELKNN